MKLMMIKEMLFYLFIVAFVPLAMSNPVKLDAGTNVHVRLIREAAETRSRRSAHEVQNGHLPEELTFGVGMPGSDVTLRMKRSKLLPTVTNNGAVDVSVQHAAVYTDHSKHSAMIVKREADQYKLKGSFVHKDVEWDLEPLAKQTRSSQTHQVKQRKGLDSVISFEGDEYYIENREKPEIPPSQQQDNNNRNNNNRNNNRHKRSVVDHVVEIAFIADFADYKKWIDFVGSTNALTEMQLWYTYVADLLNIRYQTIDDPYISISTRVTILKILTEPSESAFIDDLVDVNTIHKFDNGDGLRALKNWHMGAKDLPTSDHYMLFTGYNRGDLLGVALGGELCTPSSVSINENTFQGTIGFIAAHELGHSLSAKHDSNTTCNNDQEQYVMSTRMSNRVLPDNEGNSWKFSQCSIQAFKNYLQSVSCTLPENTNIPDELPAPGEGQRGGEVLSLDTQCQRNFQSDSSRFCEQVQVDNGGIESLCGGMYCEKPGGYGICEPIVPLEYSSCGTEKWCVLGSCVDKPTNPPSATTTPTTATTTTTTTATTQSPSRKSATTIAAQIPSTTTSTTPPTSTSTRRTRPTRPKPEEGPKDFDDCNAFLRASNWDDWWKCIKSPQKSPTTTPAPTTTPTASTTTPTTTTPTTTTSSTSTRRTRPTPRPKPEEGPKDFDDCNQLLTWNEYKKCINNVLRYVQATTTPTTRTTTTTNSPPQKGPKTIDDCQPLWISRNSKWNEWIKCIETRPTSPKPDQGPIDYNRCNPLQIRSDSLLNEYTKCLDKVLMYRRTEYQRILQRWGL